MPVKSAPDHSWMPGAAVRETNSPETGIPAARPTRAAEARAVRILILLRRAGGGVDFGTLMEGAALEGRKAGTDLGGRECDARDCGKSAASR